MTEIVSLSLDEKEDEAHRYYLNATENWRNFVQVALEIKASKEWKQKAKTWEAYCETYMPVKAAYIRKFKSADETAKIIETVTIGTPNEYQLRLLKSAVPEEDKHMMPVVYKLAHDLAGDRPPSKRHYKAAYEVESELSVSGTVTVDGNSLAPTAQARIAAHKEAIMEADKRYDEHRKGNSDDWQEVRAIIGTIDTTLAHDFKFPFGTEVKLYVKDKQVKVYIQEAA